MTVDPSVLTLLEPGQQSACNLVLSLSGASVEAGTGPADPGDAEAERETIRNALYPWRDGNWTQPTQLRLYWVNDQGTLIADEDIPIAALNAAQWLEGNDEAVAAAKADDMRKALSDQYKRNLDAIVFSTDMQSVNKTEICLVLEGQAAVQEIELSDATPVADQYTRRFSAAISQLAQKLPPLNQALNLVFYATAEVTRPQSAVAFVAFPVGGANSNWDPDPSVPPGTALERHIDLTYRNRGDDNLKVYCPITRLPSTDGETNNFAPIRLREMGDFLGHVKLAVTDMEDWLPGLFARMGQFFSMPEHFIRYLLENQTQLIPSAENVTEQNAQGYVNFLLRLEDFLLTCSRDALGLGFQKRPDDTSWVQVLVLAHKETHPETDVVTMTTDVEGSLRKLDVAFTLATWRDEILKKSLSKIEGLDKIAWDIFLPTIDAENEEAIRDHALRLAVLVPEWLHAWEVFLESVKSAAVSAAIVYEQWKFLKRESDKELNELRDLLRKQHNPLPEARITQIIQGLSNSQADLRDLRVVFESLLASPQLPNLWEMQMEAAAFHCRKEILIIDQQDDRKMEAQIAANMIASVGASSDERKDNAASYNPPWTAGDPLANLPATLPDCSLAWNGFATTTENFLTLPVDPLDQDQPGRAHAALFPHEQKTYNAPPAVRLTVDTIGAGSEGATPDDDLNNEIAGHIVLMRRGGHVAAEPSGEWRCLNRVKCSVPQANMEQPFIIPAFLPEISGARRAFLELTNEKLSLIAGHQTFEDLGDPKDKTGDSGIYYSFDNSHVAKSFWYGYKYELAGFVALNSGALPKLLRGMAWNLPKGDFGEGKIGHAFSYHHLRRVPISAVRVEVKPAALTPVSLLPIAKELPEWDEQPSKDPNKKLERQWFLLADTGRYHQPHLTFTVRLPTTSFWNWYAWKGDTATAEDCQKALEKDIESRLDALSKSNQTAVDPLIDPALERRLVMAVEELFPAKVTRSIVSVPIPNEKGDHGISLKVGSDGRADIDVNVDGSAVTIKAPHGRVFRVKIQAVLREDAIRDDADTDDVCKNKFHPWMGQVMGLEADTSDAPDANDCLLAQPVEMWFETPAALEIKPKELWQSLTPIQEGDFVRAIISREDNALVSKFAQIGPVEIRHQVWHWNGRLDQSYLLEEGPMLDPDHGNPRTTSAMKWEAWAFSDRPDFSAMSHEAHLVASREAKFSQQLFSDHRPSEEKALYYRFTAVARSRYESLGGDFATRVVKAAIEVRNKESEATENPWKRLLRKCSRVDRLPKPAVRFALPLTKSISSSSDSGTDTAASLLIVLDDHWFAEAGLAEQLEVGIEILQNPGVSGGRYLNAGYDPTLTGEALPPVSPLPKNPEGDAPAVPNPVATFTPEGPIGLTFDFAAQTPKLRGCSFVLSLPTQLPARLNGETEVPVPLDKALKTWFLMRVSVRHTVRAQFCEGSSDDVRAGLSSEWTPREWVQFLPSMDFVIPKAWRHAVDCHGHVSPKFSQKAVITDEDHWRGYDQSFRDRMQQWLVVSEQVTDIGGQPCERYIATLVLDKDGKKFEGKDWADEKQKDLTSLERGYMRLVLVRRRPDIEHASGESIWKSVFGASVTERPSMTGVEDDPLFAAPLVSDRVPFSVVKQG